MLHRLEFLDLQAFILVAELGSFHEAAQRLHLSQPALSRRIQKLEELLEVELLERTTRRTQLTPIGADFLPRARRMIEEYESSILNIRELATHQKGTVTIACLPTAAFYFLPSVIRGFSEAWTGIRIRILDVSARDKTCLVEPGVSYFDLYRHLRTNKIPLWIDTADPGWGGLVGNALDRGGGYTDIDPDVCSDVTDDASGSDNVSAPPPADRLRTRPAAHRPAAPGPPPSHTGDDFRTRVRASPASAR